MTECQNCGASNSFENYNCNQCSYPIQGSYEERVKFSMGGESWKRTSEDSGMSMEEKEHVDGALKGKITVITMAIISLSMGIVLAITGESQFVVRGSEFEIAATLIFLGLGQMVIYYFINTNAYAMLLTAIILRGILFLLFILYVGGIWTNKNGTLITFWFIIEIALLTFLGLALDAVGRTRKIIEE